MALTIAQIMEGSRYAALQAAHRPTYELSDIMEPQDYAGHKATLRDTVSDLSVNIMWRRNDEFKCRTEKNKFRFVQYLMLQAVKTLDQAIAAEASEDVVFDYGNIRLSDRN